MKKYIFLLILFLVVLTNVSVKSNNFVYQDVNSEDLVSYIDDYKIVFKKSNIVITKNNISYKLEFKEIGSSNLLGLENTNLFDINYYVGNIKKEGIKATYSLSYGHEVNIFIDNKLNVVKNKNCKIFINGNDIEKSSPNLLNDDIIKITNNNEGRELKLEFSTYLGGDGNDISGSSSIDEYGNLYYTGYVSSNVHDFIKDAFQADYHGKQDYIVLKFDENNNIIWGTFVGSPGEDGSCYLDVKLGMVWVGGETHSEGFPTTGDAVRMSHTGNGDITLFRLNYDGKYEYGTYNGGSGYDTVIDVKIDELGNAWFTGRSCNSEDKFYTTLNAENNEGLGSCDGFIMGFDKFNNCIYSSLIGGSYWDILETMSITKNHIILGGFSQSNDLKNKVNDGETTSYIVGLNRKDFKTEWTHQFKGDGFNIIQSLHSVNLDSDFFYASGYTSNKSIGTNSAYQNKLNGKLDYFISKFNENGNIIKTTYLGGSENEGKETTIFQGGGIDTDNIGNVYVSGYTNSDDFPITYNAFQSTKKMNYDAFVSVFDADLTTLYYSTYIGGNEEETGRDILVFNNNLYINGWTKSDDFPITENAIQNQFGGNMDAFILKFNIGNIFEPIPEPKPINCSGELYNYSGFANLRGLKPIGYSQKRDSTLWLTDNSEYNKGAIWTEIPYDISQGFTSEFVFQLSEGSDLGHFDGFAEGGDGLAFVIQATGNDVLGFEGGGLAYEGIPNAIAIELDLYQNDEPGFNDPNGNHLSIFGSKDNISANHWSDDLIFENTDIEEIKIDNSKYKFKVVFNSVENSLEVYLNKNNEEQKSVAFIDNFDIKQYIDLIDETGVHFGITASTGNAVQIHKLNSWYYCVGSEIEDAISIKNNFAYPNPINDVFRIKEGVPYEKVILHDFVGNYYELTSTTNEFDVSNLAKGIYIIEIINGNSISHQKIIVQ